MRSAALLILLAASSAVAQVRESIRVDLVEVPVTVVDHSGDPVRGLTRANFRLYDEGKERQITGFDVIDLAAKERQTALSPVNPAARRNFLLLFDLSFTSPRSRANAQEAATVFVKKSVLPVDRVAVATLDVDHGFRLLTTFTSDRELIAAAIHNPGGFKSADPLQLSNDVKVGTLDTTGDETAQLLQTQYDMNPNHPLPALENVINGFRSEAEHGRDTNRDVQHSNLPYLRARVEKEVSFLGELARTLRAVPGRKQIVFLSEGFDASVIIGRDARAGDATKSENDDAMRSKFESVDTDQRYGSATSQRFLSDMVKFFKGSDVVLHSIDIKGLRVQNSMEGSSLDSNAGLSVLSGPTGGMLFQNANDLSASFAKMLHAQELVYVLSFKAEPRKAGDFHELKVKLVKVPGNPQVSSRSGYYERGNDTRDERTLSAAEIILNDIPQDGLKLDAFAIGFPTESGNAQVPVVLEVPGGDLVGAARSDHPAVEIYIYAFDESGGVRDRIFQRVSLDLTKLKERLYDAGLKFVATLSLPPGSYAIRSLVRMPESERRGFVRSDLVVPEHNAVAMLQPVFIDANPSWVTIRGTSHAEQERYPFHLAATEFVPAATARIRSGETPQFAVFVQNAMPDDVTIDTTPKAKLVGSTNSGGTSAFLLQLGEELPPSVATIDVVLHRKGSDGVQRASVAVAP
jgi:VWFA-related protein